MVGAGVPSGSILRPLLFLTFINDIADERDSTARLFSDDTSLIKLSSPCREIETF